MTSAQVPSRIAIKRPFAESGLITPIQDASGDSVNYPQGFPSIYGVPASEGGKYVGRGEINAIGNVATNDLFYHKCGGINTFDAAFAAKVGGYPKGAVLQYLNGNYIYDVISLIDNNMFDFASSNTIDGANWAYCNKETSSSDRILVVESSTTVSANNSQGLLLGVFKAPKNGFIVFEGNYTVNTQVGVSADGTNAGFAVALYDLGASYTTIPTLTAETLKNWKAIYTASTYCPKTQSPNSVFSATVSFTLSVTPITDILTYGNFYAIAALCGEGGKKTAYAPADVKATSATGSCKIYIQ